MHVNSQCCGYDESSKDRTLPSTRSKNIVNRSHKQRAIESSFLFDQVLSSRGS